MQDADFGGIRGMVGSVSRFVRASHTLAAGRAPLDFLPTQD